MLFVFFLISQVIPDFQVNGEDYPGSSPQVYPAIAGYDSGGAVIWYDMRYPTGGLKVYGTILNAFGDTIGANQQLNDDTTTGCMNMPSVDNDIFGNFAVVYIQQQNVLCRRFDKNGIPYGPSFIVNQIILCMYPLVAMGKSGRTMITWLEGSEYRLYGQIYDANGNPVGNNFLVSDSTLTYGILPDITVDNNNNFIVAWQFNSDIWAQRFDSLGNRVGINFKIINDTLNIGESDPRVHFDRYNNLLVSWTASVQGQSDINCQIFDSTLTPITNIIRLDNAGIDSAQRSRIAIRDSIFFVVFQNGINKIYLQRIKNNGELLGNNILINEPVGRINNLPKIDVIANYVIITWNRRFAGIMYDIVCQRVSLSGSLIGNNYVISDDKGGDAQLIPAVAADNTGNFFIVWDDYRGYYDINIRGNQYARRYASDGSPLCDEFRVNTYSNGLYSAIGVNLNSYITVWARTNPDSSHQIYAQRFDYNGNPIDTNYQISISSGNTSLTFPKTTNLSNGHWVVVYSEDNGSREIIYGRFLDENGIPFGNQFIAFVDSLAYNVGWTPVDEGNNKFIVPISCNIESLGAAVQEFDYSGNPVSAPIILNDTPMPTSFVCGAKGIECYLFVWIGATKVIGQFLNDSLQKIGTNFVISDDTLSYKNFHALVSNDDGKFFVIWDDQRNGNPDLYGQFFDSLGNKINNNFRVDNDTTNSEQSFVSCFSANNCIYIVWSDMRIPAHRYDVYCKVIEWPGAPGIHEQQTFSDQAFLSVYPNPFRNHLVIKFQIPNTKLQTNSKSQIPKKSAIRNPQSEISLKIYDTTGRLVKNFLIPPSTITHQPSVIIWSGDDDTGRRVPPGVYFVRFEFDGYKEIEKVILLK